MIEFIWVGDTDVLGKRRWACDLNTTIFFVSVGDQFLWHFKQNRQFPAFYRLCFWYPVALSSIQGIYVFAEIPVITRLLWVYTIETPTREQKKRSVSNGLSLIQITTVHDWAVISRWFSSRGLCGYRSEWILSVYQLTTRMYLLDPNATLQVSPQTQAVCALRLRCSMGGSIFTPRASCPLCSASGVKEGQAALGTRIGRNSNLPHFHRDAVECTSHDGERKTANKAIRT